MFFLEILLGLFVMVAAAVITYGVGYAFDKLTDGFLGLPRLLQGIFLIVLGTCIIMMAWLIGEEILKHV